MLRYPLASEHSFLAIFLVALGATMISSIDAFTPSWCVSRSLLGSCAASAPISSVLAASASSSGQTDTDEHPLAHTSFLSHVMLKVPSVDETVDYWLEKGGTVLRSRPKPVDTEQDPSTVAPNGTNGGKKSELLSAFVELGDARSLVKKKADTSEAESSSSLPCFALELVSAKTKPEDYSIGNCISYVGVSMLLQYQNNLLGAITGDEKPQEQGEEPNGIPVQSAASAPGDLLARWALRSSDLPRTLEFYSGILGMDAKAQDERMLCLRYDHPEASGVPTTLVFDAVTDKSEEIEAGDCFDHLVVATTHDIETLHDDLAHRSQDEDQPDSSKSPLYRIFMKPTDMFGKKVMGLLDPNGYRVIIASS